MRKGEWHEDDRRHWGQAEQPIRQHGHANIELRVVKSSLFSLYTGCLPPCFFLRVGSPSRKWAASGGSRGNGVDGEDWLLVRS